MKAVKIAGVVLLVVVVGIAGLVFYTLSNLDNLVQNAVEKYGSEVTQTKVTLQTVNIELQDGRAQLSNFVVANPAGYNSDYAFSLDDIVVQILPSSIGASRDDIIVIEEITVDGASIIAELQGLQNSNLQELADNVQSSLPADGTQAEPEPSEEYSGPNFRVQRFVFSNANISLASEELGDRRVDMPAVRVSDLGGENGLPPKELAAALMDEVLDQATRAVRSEVEGAARREIRSELQDRAEENLDEEDRERVKELRNLLGR